MKELIEQIEKKGLKVCFGLEAQGHIPTIEAIINRWNDKKQFPNEEPINMMYSKHVWEEIGKKIGWCPFTASLYYFDYLNDKAKESVSQKDLEISQLKYELKTKDIELKVLKSKIN